MAVKHHLVAPVMCKDILFFYDDILLFQDNRWSSWRHAKYMANCRNSLQQQQLLVEHFELVYFELQKPCKLYCQMYIWRMDKWLFLDELLTICALQRKHCLVILGVSILKIINRQRRRPAARQHKEAVFSFLRLSLTWADNGSRTTQNAGA